MGEWFRNLKIKRKIGKAKNFDELFKTIDDIGSVSGTGKAYIPQELRDTIKAVQSIERQWTVIFRSPEGEEFTGTPNYAAPEKKPQNGENYHMLGAPSISFGCFEEMQNSNDPLTYITRTYGLRDKVRKLLEK